MGRHKKYPDAENTIAAFYAAVSDSYRHPGAGEEVGVETSRKSINLLAEEFDISRLKVRKILITTGDVVYPATHTIQDMMAKGLKKAEICKQLKMAIATLNSFLPYEKGVYNLSDVSNAAENCRIYRERKASLAALTDAVQNAGVEEQRYALWRCVCLFSGYPFRTSGRGSRQGVKFKYTVSTSSGKGGHHYDEADVEGFGNELCIIQNGEKKEKSITRSSVDYALKIVTEGSVIIGPKQLKIYGSSYVWAIFRRFGLIHASGGRPPERRQQKEGCVHGAGEAISECWNL